MTTLQYAITSEHDGEEIQHFLRFSEGISRKVLIGLKHIPEGILLNGAHARTIDLIHTGDVLEINCPDTERKLPPCDIDVPTLWWDEDVAVFNKPFGMPVHQSGGHIFGTLASVYTTKSNKEGVPGHFRAVNRLDKDTTGAVVVARNQIAAGKLWKSVTKRYIALCEGVVSPEWDILDLPLEREAPLAMRRIVTPEGERAITEYKVLAVAPDNSCSLVGFTLHTGRTHQIRVHMSYKGWPLLGDDLYGGNLTLFPRQALHCAGVAFTHPRTSEQISLTASLPDDLCALLERVGILDYSSRIEDFIKALQDVKPTTVEQITLGYKKQAPRNAYENSIAQKRRTTLKVPKIAAFDLDGTLLKKDHKTLSDANREMLDCYHDMGCEIVVATGRSASTIAPDIRALPYLHYIITCNGATVLRGDGSVLASAPMAEKETREVLDYLSRDGSFIVQLYQCQEMFITESDWERREELRIPEWIRSAMGQNQLHLVQKLSDSLSLSGGKGEKINIPFLSEEKKQLIKEWIHKTYPGVFSTASTMPCNLEIYDRVASKSWALEQIAQNMNCPMSDTIAFGDAENDRDMLQKAGIGIAMGNGDALTKQAADMVTLSNEEDGVAFALRKLLEP